VLLEAGADPELQDKEGRDVVSLVERLRGQMPPNPALLQRRLALEQVANVLVDRWDRGCTRGGGGGLQAPWSCVYAGAGSGTQSQCVVVVRASAQPVCMA
jgi:hypothetical protein